MLLEVFNFLHFLGLAFGLGGATIAAIISRKAEKDAEIGKAFMKIIPSVSKLIWLGLILLIISGIGITLLIQWPINRQILLVKHILVFWIVFFGVVIGVKMRKMQTLSPVNSKGKISMGFLRTRKQIKVFSIINLILWYLVTLLSAFV